MVKQQSLTYSLAEKINMEILLTLNKGHFQQHFRCIMAVNEIRVLRVNNRPSCG